MLVSLIFIKDYLSQTVPFKKFNGLIKTKRRDKSEKLD